MIRLEAVDVSLEQTFYDTVDQLNAEPVQYTGTDANTGDPVDRDMRGSDYIDRVFQLVYSTESIPYLPLVITEVANGNYAAILKVAR